MAPACAGSPTTRPSTPRPRGRPPGRKSRSRRTAPARRRSTWWGRMARSPAAVVRVVRGSRDVVAGPVQRNCVRGADRAGYDIKILSLADGVTRQITFGEGTNESPAWSPNGRHLAFMSTRAGRSQIFTVDRDAATCGRSPATGTISRPIGRSRHRRGRRWLMTRWQDEEQEPESGRAESGENNDEADSTDDIGRGGCAAGPGHCLRERTGPGGAPQPPPPARRRSCRSRRCRRVRWTSRSGATRAGCDSRRATCRAISTRSTARVC